MVNTEEINLTAKSAKLIRKECKKNTPYYPKYALGKTIFPAFEPFALYSSLSSLRLIVLNVFQTQSLSN